MKNYKTVLLVLGVALYVYGALYVPRPHMALALGALLAYLASQ